MKLWIILLVQALCGLYSVLSTKLVVQEQYFLQFTDIHLDLYYQENTADNCLFDTLGMPCCRVHQIVKKPFSLSSSWGSYECDTPIKLFNETLAWIDSNLPESKHLDFILNTGDNADHHLLTQTLHDNIQANKNIHDLTKVWFPNKPIINVLGNHDTYPIDQTFPLLETYIYRELDNIWNLSNISSNPDDFRRGGFYLYEPKESPLCMLVINSIYYDDNNLIHILKEYDVNQQFDWLEVQLSNCKAKGKKVWIMNHEPPTSLFYKSTFMKLMDKFQDTILHQFYGHRHIDQFILFKKKEKVIGSGFLSPSFMPDHHDPCFRVYAYNGTHIHDYTQYCANLRKVIETNQLTYEIKYRFSDVYGQSPTTDSYGKVFNQLKTNDTLFQIFCDLYNVQENSHCSRNVLNRVEFVL